MGDKWKWRILNIKQRNGKLILTVEFAWGWKENAAVDEEGNEVVSYDYKSERAQLEIPAVMTKDQIVEYLDLYWANTYGPLDALETVLSGIEKLKGYTQTY